MKNKKGFSIGEVLIAMFILLVGMVDAVFLTVRSVGDLTNSRDAVIATLLAQEGTELVRNVRDNNVTQMDCGVGDDERCTAFDQNYGFPSTTLSDETWCTIDYNTDGDDPNLDCSAASRDDKIYLNTERMLYSHSGGGGVYDTDMNIRRIIYIDYDTTDNAESPHNIIANVTSMVVFGDADFPRYDDIESDCKIGNKCVYAQTRLTSWINYGD